MYAGCCCVMLFDVSCCLLMCVLFVCLWLMFPDCLLLFGGVIVRCVCLVACLSYVLVSFVCVVCCACSPYCCRWRSLNVVRWMLVFFVAC